MVLFVLIPSAIRRKSKPLAAAELCNKTAAFHFDDRQNLRLFLFTLSASRSNYDSEGLLHDEQVKTGVTPLLNPSRLRPETRDYNNSPPSSIIIHTLYTHV